MTKRDVFNMALLTIGEAPIDGSTESTNVSLASCELWWIPTVKAVETCIHWSELVKLSTVYPTGLSDVRGVEYNKPPRFLALLEADGERAGDGWTEEGGYIYRKGGSVRNMSVKYLQFCEEPDLWSPELLDCVVELLAANIFTPVTKQDNTAKKEHFWNVTRMRAAGQHLRRTKPTRRYTDNGRLS